MKEPKPIESVIVTESECSQAEARFKKKYFIRPRDVGEPGHIIEITTLDDGMFRVDVFAPQDFRAIYYLGMNDEQMDLMMSYEHLIEDMCEDSARGKKVIQGASKSGEARWAPHQRNRPLYEQALYDYVKEKPNHSLEYARTVVGSNFDPPANYKTVERSTAGFKERHPELF